MEIQIQIFHACKCGVWGKNEESGRGRRGYQDIFRLGMLAIVGVQQLSTFVPAFKLTVCSLLVWMYSPSRSFLRGDDFGCVELEGMASQFVVGCDAKVSILVG